MGQTWAVDVRPKRFSEIVGQEHIAPTLRAAIVKERTGAESFPPALVLYGPRGTGKTSMARILARALNCADPPSDGEPCGKCDVCLSIDANTSAGVQEFDMASNGSVDDVRRLKQSSAFALSEDWRIYILDEVHSATKQAFDALLKLLEEPPPKCLFLLVTTEHDQIPETIRSRCLEYDFRRVTAGHIVGRLKAVAEVKGVADRIDESVYHVLAVRSRGGLRDAVMSLQQLCMIDGPLTAETAALAFGLSDLPERILDAALKGDLQRGLGLLSEDLGVSISPLVLADAMMDGITGLLSAAAGNTPEPGRAVSPEWISTHAPGLRPGILIPAQEVLWAIRGRMSSSDPSSAAAQLMAGYALLVSKLAPSVLSSTPFPVPPLPGQVPQASAPSAITAQAEREVLYTVPGTAESLNLSQLRSLVDADARTPEDVSRALHPAETPLEQERKEPTGKEPG